MTARRRAQPVTSTPTTVLRWRMLIHAGLLLIFALFLLVAVLNDDAFQLAVAMFGILAALGGAADALYGHRYEASLLRRIASEAYRAQYAEAELARWKRLYAEQVR